MGCIPILALGNLPSPLATLPLSAAFNLCRITYIVDNDRAAFGQTTIDADRICLCHPVALPRIRLYTLLVAFTRAHVLCNHTDCQSVGRPHSMHSPPSLSKRPAFDGRRRPRCSPRLSTGEIHLSRSHPRRRPSWRCCATMHAHCAAVYAAKGASSRIPPGRTGR